MFSANLLCYKQLFFLEKRKQKIISLAADQNYSFWYFNFNVVKYFEIISDIQKHLYTFNPFLNTKIIFIENISALFELKNKLDFSFLFNFIKNPQKKIILFISLDCNNVNFKFFYNKLKPFMHVEEIFSINNYRELYEYILKTFEYDNFKISSHIKPILTKKLINHYQDDLFLLEQEINKIKSYYIEDKIIHDSKIIKELIFNESDQNILSLIKLLVDKKILESYLLFNNLTNKFQNFFSIFFQLMKTLQELILIYFYSQNDNNILTISYLCKFSFAKTSFFLKEINNLNIKSLYELFLLNFKFLYKLKIGVIKYHECLNIFLQQVIYDQDLDDNF
ncbi:MAG: hypothetical protein Q8897_00365 [Sweet potato little leaf phytoplasma]|uniref:DNA polymerase III subunit delta n=2 Tax=Candidatus Phytoplasma TaxID=33926 RepID=A0ABP2TFK3_PEWBP|nr:MULTISPECIES: hypothetical protein [Phytoplasma]QLL37102.1 DNA polymerase III subunit delta ['Echinacea purpurea' witches'-broom phytoplasma]WEX20647.1 MAG: DNA polymerase III subunit delta [Candidatus Phytoplasma aurantifolia]WKV64355.1 MAG: DNA polymerase III subunit delta [Candidatus Phytoplasma australasiaticum]EMR14482.1 DNA polymerase III subunit delta [Peanut witches'-broom phytoplasma NTU2011]MDO7987050.1 hypothetical protein [Sweet potato little leaf phytoplasma]